MCFANCEREIEGEDVPDRNRVVEEGSSRLGEGDCNYLSVNILLPSSSLFSRSGGGGRTLEEAGWDIHHRSEVVVDRSNPATTFCLSESVLSIA